MKATHRLIDSVWTIEYEVVSPTEVKIIAFSRDDEEGYRKERQLPQGTIVEDDERTAKELLIRNEYLPFASWVNEENCDCAYIITNPKFIFDYKPE